MAAQDKAIVVNSQKLKNRIHEHGTITHIHPEHATRVGTAQGTFFLFTHLDGYIGWRQLHIDFEWEA